MFELRQISQQTYYIQSPAKIGLVRLNAEEVVLIDSGNDKDAGRKVRQILDANRWKLKAIYNTHANADHIGGNRYLQGQTGCRVFAPGIEQAFTRHPILEPSFLYGGYPCKDLRHKFLMAQPSEALPLTEDCLPGGVQAVPLPGHSWDMTGFRTEEGIVFLADCLSGAETLEKYRISFLTDVGAYIETLEAVKTMEARLFIPSHAEAAEDIVPLAELNLRAVREIADTITELCRTPVSFEGLLRQLFSRYGLAMDFQQHALVGSTVRSYLSWLKDRGLVRAFFEDNTLLWQA